MELRGDRLALGVALDQPVRLAVTLPGEGAGERHNVPEDVRHVPGHEGRRQAAEARAEGDMAPRVVAKRQPHPYPGQQLSAQAGEEGIIERQLAPARDVADAID